MAKLGPELTKCAPTWVQGPRTRESWPNSPKSWPNSAAGVWLLSQTYSDSRFGGSRKFLECRPISAFFGAIPAEFARIRQTSGRVQPKLGQTRTMLDKRAQVWMTSTEVGHFDPVSAKFGLTPTEVGECLAHAGQVRSDFGRCWPKSGANFAEDGSESEGVGPN